MDPFAPQPQPQAQPEGLPPGLDPLADPVFAALAGLDAPEEPTIGPDPRAWDRFGGKPKRPKPAATLAAASRAQEDAQDLLTLWADTDRRLALDSFGVFGGDRDKVRAGEIEPFYDRALVDEHELACITLSDMDVAYDALHRDAIDQEESAAKEDLLTYLDENEARQRETAGMGDLRWAEIDDLRRRGMIVGFDGIDPHDEACGLRMRLVDPATTYPVEEDDHGPSAVARVYRTTAGRLTGQYGHLDGGKVRRKIAKRATAADAPYDPHAAAEVTEWWDRNWFQVLWDGEELLTLEHGYARVPFTFEYLPYGEQRHTRTLDGASVPDAFRTKDGRPIFPGGVTSGEDRASRRRQAIPAAARHFRTHDIKEATMGRLLTEVKKGLRPPFLLQQTMIGQQQGTPQEDIQAGNVEGGVVPITDQETPLPWPVDPKATTLLGPLLGAIQTNGLMGGVPAAMAGANPAAQTSGNAIDILNQAGLQRFVPDVRAVQRFKARRAEWRLTLIRDWGAILGAAGDRGMLLVPARANPRTGRAPAHEVTPETIHRTGTRVDVQLHRTNPPTGELANTVMILKNAGLLSQHRAFGWMGITDPEGEAQRLREEQLSEVPEVQQAETVELLFRRVQQAVERGDLESAKIAYGRATYVSGVIAEAQMQKAVRNASMQMNMMPPGIPPDMAEGMGPEAMPGVPTAGPELGPEDAINYQGANIAQYGMQPGQEGGRPPGS